MSRKCIVLFHSPWKWQALLNKCQKVNDVKAAYLVRAASLAAGFPNSTAASTVNRFCSSGLKAVQDIANQISAGSIECGIAIGAESMTAAAKGEALSPFHEDILKNQEAQDCMQPMGQTSENVGSDFNISREAQDRFAAESYQRAERAQKAGWFDDEIVPITTTIRDPKSGEETSVTLTKDEGPRYGTTFESLSKIRPAFPQFGERSTGGNSSQITDGGKTSPLQVPLFQNAYQVLLSRCYPHDETLHSHCSQPAHTRQILRGDRRGPRASDHGYRPLARDP